MQNYTSTSYGGATDCNASPFLDQSDGYDYTSLYCSIFPSDRSLFSLSPSAYSDANNNTTEVPIVVDHNQFLDLAPFQDLIGRRNWCLSQLGNTAKEAEALRQENINLRMTNTELNRRLSLLRQGHYFAPPSSCTLPSSFVSDNNFRRMKIGEKAASERRAWNEERAAASEVVNDPVERTDGDRVKLPKSISIRSNGYLKTVQGNGTSGARVRVPNRVKTATEAQRVYVHGGKKEEQPLELDVFNQGMSKTELCNKWQQTGACPYGEHCQFAHGIGELRPVLRHPRYKTEVCRMVLAGDHCPYGHRCHFRHSLTEEEMLMGQQMNAKRSLKLYQ